MVSAGGRAGYIDGNGKFAINPQFEGAAHAVRHGGLLAVGRRGFQFDGGRRDELPIGGGEGWKYGYANALPGQSAGLVPPLALVNVPGDARPVYLNP